MLKQNLITNFNFFITETTLFSLKKIDKCFDVLTDLLCALYVAIFNGQYEWKK